MERIRRGFRLLGASWEVIKQDRELLVLPLISFLAIAIAGSTLAGIGWAADVFDAEGGRLSAMAYVLLFAFYFVTYFIGIFFNAAVVGAAMIRLNGGDPTVRDGLRAAGSKVGKIAGWAAVSATVGIILHSLEERAGFLGRIVIAIVGAAWSAVTFFVVPVLLFEPVGVFPGVKRSASLFKQRWGEQFTGNVSIGLAMFLVALPLAAVTALLFTVNPVLGIVVGIVAFGLLAAIGSALSGVFSAALYRFATTGESSGAFTQDDLSGSFRPRRGWGS
jgi:hypothetical protein